MLLKVHSMGDSAVSLFGGCLVGYSGFGPLTSSMSKEPLDRMEQGLSWAEPLFGRTFEFCLACFMA